MAETQEAGATLSLQKTAMDPEVKMEGEEDSVGEAREPSFLPKQSVKEEPEEGPSGNWDAQLREFVMMLQAHHSSGETPQLPERRQEDDGKTAQAPCQSGTEDLKGPQIQPRCIGENHKEQPALLEAAPRAKRQEEVELWRQHFRTLCYQDAGGPRELCGQLLECCRQWLKPERHTKEQIVELVALEQFLAVLPLEMQSWVRGKDPETCAEAATLAEDFLLSQRNANGLGQQITGMCEEESLNNPPNAKRVPPGTEEMEVFVETKQEGGESAAVLVPSATAPAKAPEAGKRKKEMILLKVKKEIIRKYEEGMRVTDLAREYGKNVSTITSVLKMRDKITQREAAKGVTMITKHRPPVLEEVEKLLLLWIEEKQRAGNTVTEAVACAKAKALHADLLAQHPGTSADAKVFKASKGWFERFKARSGVRGVAKHGEATNAVVPAAVAFATEFLEAMVSGGYHPQQVFSCDETGLFWRRMPRRTFLTQEEAKLPGHKPMKDRLTLLLCANASGDLKIKPLLVYHSENPRAFKTHKVKKEELSVLWRSHPRAWVTRPFFAEWVNQVFGPAVKQYLLDKSLPLKAVLVMDSAPAHPPGLEGKLAEEFAFIKVMFLPPVATLLLQPMDQQVISNFKTLYTRELFRRCLDMTGGVGLALRDYWRRHFDIVSGLQLLQMAWDGVSPRDLNAAWRNLWPDCVVPPDPSAPEPAVVQEILFLGRTMGLEVSEEDICELVEGYYCDLTTKDLMELQQIMEG